MTAQVAAALRREAEWHLVRRRVWAGPMPLHIQWLLDDSRYVALPGTLKVLALRVYRMAGRDAVEAVLEAWRR